MNISMAFAVLLSSGPLLARREHRSQSIVLSNSGRGMEQRQRRLTLAPVFTFCRSMGIFVMVLWDEAWSGDEETRMRWGLTSDEMGDEKNRSLR